MDSDFAVHGEVLPLLRYEAQKLGNNEKLPNAMLVQQLNMFAISLKGKKNGWITSCRTLSWHREAHIRYTGVNYEKILQNVERLKTSGKLFVIRVPH